MSDIINCLVCNKEINLKGLSGFDDRVLTSLCSDDCYSIYVSDDYNDDFKLDNKE